jgi:hypothetical protein
MRKRSIQQTGDRGSANQKRFMSRLTEVADECEVSTMLIVVAFDNEKGTTDTTTLMNGCPACRVANLEALLERLRESCPTIDFPSPRPKEGSSLEHLH